MRQLLSARTLKSAALCGSLLALALVLSCVGNRSRSGDSCYDSADCTTTDGSLEACVNGFCEQVECLSSSDCDLGSVCDVESLDYECETGCITDTDCEAGSTCQEGQCQDYGCRSTLLDCEFGEVCDEGTGECVQADGAYCASCSLGDNVWDDGGTGSTCDDVILSNSTCGGAGSFCVNWYNMGGVPFCYVACEEQSDCPGGYLCQLMTRTLPAGCPDPYLVLGMACVADCPED